LGLPYSFCAQPLMKRTARWQDVSRNGHRGDYCLRFCASVASWRYSSPFIVSPATIC